MSQKINTEFLTGPGQFFNKIPAIYDRNNNPTIEKVTDVLAVFLYFLIGIGFILLFLYLHTSADAREFLAALNNPSGFRAIIFFGIVKLLSAILGVTIVGAVMYKIITDFTNRKNPA